MTSRASDVNKSRINKIKNNFDSLLLTIPSSIEEIDNIVFDSIFSIYVGVKCRENDSFGVIFLIWEGEIVYGTVTSNKRMPFSYLILPYFSGKVSSHGVHISFFDINRNYSENCLWRLYVPIAYDGSSWEITSNFLMGIFY